MVVLQQVVLQQDVHQQDVLHLVVQQLGVCLQQLVLPVKPVIQNILEFFNLLQIR